MCMVIAGAAEEGARQRPALDLTVFQPGVLTDDPGTGLVTLARHVDEGSISRDDVAPVILALLDAPRPGTVLEPVSGTTPVADALAPVSGLSRGGRG